MESFDNIINRKGTLSVKWDPDMFPVQENGAMLPKIPQDPDMIPMWVADMDFSAPPFVIEAIKKRLEHPVLGYTMCSPQYYESIIKWMETEHNWKISKEWICSLPTTVVAINMVISSYTKPGDKILIHTPNYYPIPLSILSNGRRLVENELVLRDNNYYIDFDDLETKLKDPKLKMMILCSPHNPAGRVWTKEEVNKMCKLCTDNDVLLLSDEIWADLIFDTKNHYHFPAGKISPDNTITVFGPTKAFNVAGLSITIAIVPNKKLRAELVDTYAKSGFFGGNMFAAIGLEACYSQGKQWLTDLKIYIQRNIDYVIEFCSNKLEGKIIPISPQASYLIWLDCRKMNMKDEELNKFFLEKTKLWLSAGKGYGTGGEGFMRINVACPKSRLEEAMNRIAKCMHEEKMIS